MAKASKTVAAAPLNQAEVIKKAMEAASIAQPHAEFIYVNVSTGHYHLHPRPGFIKVDMVDGEIIAEPVKKERVPKTAPADKAAKPEIKPDATIVADDGKEF